MCYNSSGDFVKWRFSVGLRWGSRFCMSNRLSGVIDLLVSRWPFQKQGLGSLQPKWPNLNYPNKDTCCNCLLYVDQGNFPYPFNSTSMNLQHLTWSSPWSPSSLLLGLAIGSGLSLLGYQGLGSKGEDLTWGTVEIGPRASSEGSR